jgi:cell division septation protein DedD
VQVAAFKTRDAADKALSDLKRMGYGAFITTDGGYLKVRAGPFPSQDNAAAAARRIQQRLKGKPFVTQAPVP